MSGGLLDDGLERVASSSSDGLGGQHHDLDLVADLRLRQDLVVRDGISMRLHIVAQTEHIQELRCEPLVLGEVEAPEAPLQGLVKVVE